MGSTPIFLHVYCLLENYAFLPISFRFDLPDNSVNFCELPIQIRLSFRRFIFIWSPKNRQKIGVEILN